MPRREPLGRALPGDILDGMKVKMRRDADGKLVPVVPPKAKVATTEAKPDPRDQPDPRPAGTRNVPPYGAGL